MKKFFAALLVVAAGEAAMASGNDTSVIAERVPENGVQPQVAVASDGVVHLVYLKGDPRNCDVRYTRRKPGDANWETPITVNSVAGSAIAAGTIRGAQMALGKGGSVQIVWNGHGPQGTDWRFQLAPMLHARREPGASSFSAQQNLLDTTTGLDGGASIAAAADGTVYVVWHGLPQGKEGESERVVLVRRSSDDGRTFAPPEALTADRPGVCPCCSLRAHLGEDGTLTVLYRAATSPEDRGMHWLSVTSSGDIQNKPLHAWRIARCPMSSASMIGNAAGMLRGAWETDGRVFTGILSTDAKPSSWQPFGKTEAKHPSLAVNGRGEILLAVAAGAGMGKAGKVSWRLIDAQGKPGEAVLGPDLPMTSFPVAYARPDGAFGVLY